MAKSDYRKALEAAEMLLAMAGRLRLADQADYEHAAAYSLALASVSARSSADKARNAAADAARIETIRRTVAALVKDAKK
jgi:hypothetical protein